MHGISRLIKKYVGIFFWLGVKMFLQPNRVFDIYENDETDEDSLPAPPELFLQHFLPFDGGLYVQIRDPRLNKRLHNKSGLRFVQA